MKSWIKKSLFTVLGASVALGGLSACSSARPWHHDASPEQMAQMQGKMVERIGSKLDLNAEQKQKLQTLTDVLLAQRKAMAGSAGDPRAQAQALVAGERFDRTAAQSLLDEKTRAVQAGGPAVIAALGDFYDSLQPAQQQKVRDMMQRRRGWMASHG